MDANLNNSAAAIISAQQAQPKSGSGSATSVSLRAEERADSASGKTEGRSDFSNTINNLEDNSVKESRQADSSNTATEAPSEQPSEGDAGATASNESQAKDTPQKASEASSPETAEASPDGNDLPPDGKALPKPDPLSGSLASATELAELTELAIPAELADATLPVSPDGSASQTIESKSPVTAATPGTESLAETLPEETLPHDLFSAETAAAPAMGEPVQPEAAINAAVAAPANAAGPQRAGNETSLLNERPTTGSLPATSISLAPGSANAGQSAMTGGENLLGGENQPQARGELAAMNNSPTRAAFSLDLPANAASPLTASAGASAASSALKELDAMAMARPLQPTGGQEGFARGLGERLLVMADAGLQSARIKLNPEHLGPMEIRIQVQDEATQVWFNAGQSQTREILEQALPRLRELMADQGMRLTDANVSGGNAEQGGETQEDSTSDTRDWREPPPFSRAERLQAGQLRELISARRLLDVYA